MVGLATDLRLSHIRRFDSSAYCREEDLKW